MSSSKDSSMRLAMVMAKTSHSSSANRSCQIDSQGSGSATIEITNSGPSTKSITFDGSLVGGSGNSKVPIPDQQQWNSPVLPSIPTCRKVGTVLWKKSVSKMHYDIVRKYVFCRENDPYASNVEGNEAQYFVFLKGDLMLPVPKRRVEFFRGGVIEENVMQQEMRHFINIPPLNGLLEQKSDGDQEKETAAQNCSTAEVVIAAREAAEEADVDQKQKEQQAAISSSVPESLVPCSSPSPVKEQEEKVEGNLEYVPLLPPLHTGSIASIVTLPSNRTARSSVVAVSEKNSIDYQGLRVAPLSRSPSLLVTFSAPRGVLRIGTICVTVPQEEVHRYTERIDAEGNVEFEVFGQEMLGVRPFYVNYKGEKVFIENRKQIQFDRLAPYAKQRRRSSTTDVRRKSSTVFSSRVLT